MYDSVGKLGWKVDIRHHPISQVITKVIEAEGEWEMDRDVPLAKEEEDCVVSVFRPMLSVSLVLIRV